VQKSRGLTSDLISQLCTFRVAPLGGGELRISCTDIVPGCIAKNVIVCVLLLDILSGLSNDNGQFTLVITGSILGDFGDDDFSWIWVGDSHSWFNKENWSRRDGHVCFSGMLHVSPRKLREYISIIQTKTSHNFGLLF